MYCSVGRRLRECQGDCCSSVGLGRWFREWVFGKGLGSVRLLGKGLGSVGLGRRFREWEVIGEG